jgi:CubicO group peptidase (beta-lactamase class C family)
MLTRRTLLIVPLAFAATALFGQPKLDEVAERTRRTFEVPGLAVAIVKDGQAVFAKGYGVRRLGEDAPVTKDTLFGIASNTKAFTAAALAILVDEGKLAWDDRVVDHLPHFQMADPYVTREMTVRDLLVHRSGLGLGAGDLLYWPQSDFTSDEIVKRLRYVPLATSFRSKYAYDNALYLVAGKVVQAASGMPWEQFVKDRIFTPLGMKNSVTQYGHLPKGANVAIAHAKEGDRLVPIPQTSFDNNAPAGSIIASVDELTQWMILQLRRGDLGGGKRLFSEKQANEMWTPHTIMPIGNPPPSMAATKPNFQTYALGWMVSDFKGHRIVHHTGGLAGMVSRTMLVPDMNLGVVVLTNAEVRGGFDAMVYTALDHYLGGTPTDWVTALKAAQDKREAEAKAAMGKAAAQRAAASKPSLALASYAGRYRDAWYGDVLVEETGGSLGMRFTHSPALTGKLEHYQYDTFIVRWGDRTMLADAYVTFTLTAEGTIAMATMKAVSPLTDFSFDFHDLLLRPVAKDAKPY